MGKNELPIEEQSIRVLNLRGRISNTLERNGINTIGQLIIMTEEELSNVEGLGQGGQYIIKRILSDRELSLRQVENKVPMEERSIRELNIHGRTSNTLEKNGIITIGQLINLTEQELSKFEGLGSDGLDSIIMRLRQRGLSLKKEEDKTPIEEKSIRELNIHGRTSNTLENNGIKTIGQLIGYTEEELSRIEGLGNDGLDSIIMRLRQRGLSLKKEENKIPIEERSIRELKIPIRNFSTLEKNGIKTIGQLISLTEEELSNMNGLGDGGHRAIIRGLCFAGLCLKKEDNEIEQKNIKVLKLYSKIRIILEKNGIKTIGQLISLTEEELSNIPDLYEGYQTEIIMSLCENGLILRRDNTRQNYHDEVENFESSVQGNKQNPKEN